MHTAHTVLTLSSALLLSGTCRDSAHWGVDLSQVQPMPSTSKYISFLMRVAEDESMVSEVTGRVEGCGRAGRVKVQRHEGGRLGV
jgi:hypothetical protein